MQTLKIAMLFECARAAKIGSCAVIAIQENTLKQAILHAEECMRGAKFSKGAEGYARISRGAKLGSESRRHRA